MDVLSDATLDEVLAIQMTVAWAGESGADPLPGVKARLGWWRSDLVDEMGGQDLLRRMFRRTGAWAALASAREVAASTERTLRQHLGEGDQVVSLFNLGFAADEALTHRLRTLKRLQADTDTLPWRVPLQNFSVETLQTAFCGGRWAQTEFAVVAGGRLLRGAPPGDLRETVGRLAAATFLSSPLPPHYPMAFYRTAA